MGVYYIVCVQIKQKFHCQSFPGATDIDDKIIGSDCSDSELSLPAVPGTVVGSFTHRKHWISRTLVSSRHILSGLDPIATLVPSGLNVAHFSLVKILKRVVSISEETLYLENLHCF